MAVHNMSEQPYILCSRPPPVTRATDIYVENAQVLAQVLSLSSRAAPQLLRRVITHVPPPWPMYSAAPLYYLFHLRSAAAS
eukprot:12248195-Karenia_brevis.AAC.1